MNPVRTHRLRALALGAVVATGLALTMSASSAPRSAGLGPSSYDGTGIATMQQVTVQARIGRVHLVPGSGSREAWAVGHSSARLPGWSTTDAGQIVFLRNINNAGWELVGPPKDASGKPFDPTLYSFALAANGEGWAVGEEGVMLRRSPGSSDWREIPEAGSVAGRGTADPAVLNSVSLVADGSGVAGFAVGVTGGAGANAGTTILRYANGRWESDPVGADIITDGRPELTAVSAVSRDSAWAITGSGSSSLKVYRRTSSGWEAVSPDSDPQYPTFGGPRPNVPAQMKNGGINDAAFGGAVAATEDGAWVGGQMFPRDALHPQGSDTGGDKSRPFMIRFTGSGPVSYCPDQYGTRQQSENTPDPSAACDNPFPFTIYDITSINILPGNEVMAAGLGLFRFKNGQWSREPNSTGYIVSATFASASEGWVATSGNTFGAGGAIASSENSLGHWTKEPQTARMARWPQPQHEPVQGVAVAQDGSGRALAVGKNGAALAYARGVGWDYTDRTTLSDLHGVAWADPATAWAVGAQGALQRFDGRSWVAAKESGIVTARSLFDVAFAAPNDGIAVGAGGTILRFDGTTWRRDAASGRITGETLYDIEARAGVVVAVGAKGTVIERVGGAWRRDSAAAGLLARGSSTPTLNSVSIAPDATVVAAGTRGSLIVRSPGSSRFRIFESPIEGNILAIGAAGSSSALRLFASVEPKTGLDAAKFSGDKMFATRSVMMAYRSGKWRDISLSRKRSIYNSTDSSAYVDPVYSISVETPDTAWAVGGISESQPDPEHPARLVGTSAVYRIDMVDDPAPQFSTSNVSLPTKGVNVAFLAETWCERGPCGMTMGSGTQADMVASQIRDEIGLTTKMQNGPKFALFGGNGRWTGIPEELVQLKGYLQSLPVPAYAAIGNHDLIGVDSLPGQQDAQSLVDAVFPGGGVDPSGLSVGTHEHWKQVFADAPAPWGSGAPPRGLSVKEVRLPTSAPPAPDLAKTHYAFDYMRGGKAVFRVVVIDSSTRSYGRSSDQNPNEDQRVWVPDVLRDASLQGIPTIVAMNQPTILPDRTPQPNWTTDAPDFSRDTVTYQVSAVLTGGGRMNVQDGYPSADQAVVPVYIMGTGGAPLGYDKRTPSAFDASKLVTDGFYNAWFLINIDPDVPCPLGVRCTANVTVTPFPILESIAAHAWDGSTAAAGNTLRFSAESTALTGGVSDIEQSKSTHFTMGYSSLGLCEGRGQHNGQCASRDAMAPPFRFYSENPEIADFVVPAVGDVDVRPRRDPVTNRVVRDPGGRFGLLCTFKLGSTYINIESGFKRARMKIDVGGGFGPCVDKPVIGPPAPPPLAPPAAPEIAPKPFFRPPFPILETAGLILPPAPAPIVAPAPPASAAGARQEKKEAQYEQQGDEGGEGSSELEFRALPSTLHNRKVSLQSSGLYLFPATAILLGLLGAIAAAGVRKNSTHEVRTAPVKWEI